MFLVLAISYSRKAFKVNQFHISVLESLATYKLSSSIRPRIDMEHRAFTFEAMVWLSAVNQMSLKYDLI